MDRQRRSDHNRAVAVAIAAIVAVVILLPSPSFAGSVNDCHGVRYAYRERGLDLKDVPRQPRQGKRTGVR